MKKCLQLTTKTPEQRQWRPSGVFIANFEQIPHLFLSASLSDYFQIFNDVKEWLAKYNFDLRSNF